MKLYVIGFCLLSSAAYAAPRVTFSNGVISAVPDTARPPLKEQLDILEKEGCTAQKGARRIQLASGCSFLRGLYRYAFLDRDTKAQRAVFIEFTAFRTPQGHAFIAAAPLELVAPVSSN